METVLSRGKSREMYQSGDGDGDMDELPTHRTHKVFGHSNRLTSRSCNLLDWSLIYESRYQALSLYLLCANIFALTRSKYRTYINTDTNNHQGACCGRDGVLVVLHCDIETVQTALNAIRIDNMVSLCEDYIMDADDSESRVTSPSALLDSMADTSPVSNPLLWQTRLMPVANSVVVLFVRLHTESQTPILHQLFSLGIPTMIYYASDDFNSWDIAKSVNVDVSCSGSVMTPPAGWCLLETVEIYTTQAMSQHLIESHIDNVCGKFDNLMVNPTVSDPMWSSSCVDSGGDDVLNSDEGPDQPPPLAVFVSQTVLSELIFVTERLNSSDWVSALTTVEACGWWDPHITKYFINCRQNPGLLCRLSLPTFSHVDCFAPIWQEMAANTHHFWSMVDIQTARAVANTNGHLRTMIAAKPRCYGGALLTECHMFEYHPSSEGCARSLLQYVRVCL